jgi:hypothetical protein
VTLTLTIKAADGATEQIILPAPVINAVGVPVLTPVNFTLPTNPLPSGTIGSIAATNLPTSFQIVSGDPNHYFAIGPHHTSVPAPVPPDGIYNLMVSASNAAGAGPAVPVTVTVGKSITLVPATFTPSLPVTAGEAIAAIAHAGGTPVSWTIIAGDTSGFFSIDKNGVLTVTAAGVAGLKAFTTYSLTIQATNAFGSVSGMFKVSPLNSPLGSSAFPISGASIDVKFDTNQVFGGTMANLFSVSSNGGYGQNSSGLATLFGANVLRRTDQGLITEHASTSIAASVRDLTNAAWTKTNMTAALTATGIEGNTNTATILTATAPNATVTQAITRTGNSILTVCISRVTGVGEVDLSVDGGTTWFTCDSRSTGLMGCTRALDANYQWLQLMCFANNPTLALRITTSGDAVAVDFFDCQAAANFLNTYALCGTTPIPGTGGGTRNQDQITAAGALATLLQGSAMTVLIEIGGMGYGPMGPPGAYNCYSNTDNNPSGGKGSVGGAMLWDITNNNSAFTSGNPYATAGSFAGTQSPIVYTRGQDFNANIGPDNGGRTSPIGDGGWHAPSKFCFAQDGTGSSFTFNGSTVQTSASKFTFSSAVLLFLNMGCYIKRITAWNSRLSDTAIVAAALVPPTLPLLPEGAFPGTDYYIDYTAGKEQTLTLADGNNYGCETGQLGAPGGTPTGTYSQIRGSTDGKLVRLALLPGDPCGYGVDVDTTKERREINGGYSAGPGPIGINYADGTTIWVSYAVARVPGIPILAHDFLSIFQTHSNNSPGLGPTLTLGTSGQERFLFTNEPAATTYGNPFIWKMAFWDFFVHKITFSNASAGEWTLNVNGVQWFSQTGIKTVGAGDTSSEVKIGVYSFPSAELRALFVANFRQSTSSLASKITTPDPIPSGYGTISNWPKGQ